MNDSGAVQDSAVPLASIASTRQYSSPLLKLLRVLVYEVE